MVLMGQSFKRRKLSSSPSTDSQPSSSHSRRQHSHGLEDVQPSPVFEPRVDEVHVHIRNHSPVRSTGLFGEDGYHRHHRRQTGTGILPSSSSSTLLVSVVASVDASGSTVDVSTLTNTSSSPSSTTVDSGSSSATFTSASPQGTVTTPTYPLTSTTTLISSGTAPTSATSAVSGTALTTTALSGAASTTDAQTTTMSSTDTASNDTSTTLTSQNTSHGIIGLSATSASVTSAASGASLSTTLFPTGSNSTIAATISGSTSLRASPSGQQTISSSASGNRNLTTSAIIISGDHTTYTSFTTFNRVSTIDGSSTTTGTTFGVGSTYTDYTTFMTTLAGGVVSTVTQERAAVVTSLSSGDLTTSYGSYVAYSTGSFSSFGSTSLSGSTSGSVSSGTSSLTSTDPSVTATSAVSSQSHAQTAGSGSAGGSGTSTASGSASSSTGTISGDSSTNDATPPASVLAGGIVGGVAGLAVLLLVAMVFLRWYRKRGASMQPLTQSEAAAAPVADAGGPHGPGMAERAGLAPVLMPLLGAIGLGRNRSRAPSDTGERGFQRVSGRKLPSAFSEGMTSQQPTAQHPALRPPPMPAFNSDNNHSSTSFYRDSTGFYGGEGASGTSPFADPADLDASETIMPGPARQATVHPPYALSPTSAATASPMTPTFPERQHMLPPNSPPGTANRSVTPATMSSFEGSRGSRFTEEV